MAARRCLTRENIEPERNQKNLTTLALIGSPTKENLAELLWRVGIPVSALVLVLLIQVSALASIPRVPLAAAALVLAEVTGRAAVVVATGSPAARPSGFGALVAGRTAPRDRVATVVLLGCAVAVAGFAAGGAGLAARGLIAALAGLIAGGLLQRVARRRLGGMTGDVFGAILQVSAAATAVSCALMS